jgi:hypothetical protein
MGIYQISLNVFKIIRRKKMSSYQEVFDIEIKSDIKSFFSSILKNIYNFIRNV